MTPTARRIAIGSALASVVIAAGVRWAMRRSAVPAESAAPAPAGSVGPKSDRSLRSLASKSAFDLAAVPGGALLAWGPAESDGGGTRVVRLDSAGRSAAAEITLGTTAAAVEVAMVTTEERAAVVWLAAERDRAVARAAIVSLEATSPPPVVELGLSSLGEADARGHVAASTLDGGRWMVAHRGGVEPCASPEAVPCIGFSFSLLSDAGVEKRGIGLAVPAPCGGGLAAYVTDEGRWRYAVCSLRTGAPSITLFDIQQSPMYASTTPVLEGCSPNGFALVDGATVIRARCGEAGQHGADRAARTPAGGTPERLDLDDVELSCTGERAAIRSSGPKGIDLSLDAPRSHIEALLPARLASSRARAAWTGSTLLVAEPDGPHLVVAAYRCEHSVLVGSGETQ